MAVLGMLALLGGMGWGARPSGMGWGARPSGNGWGHGGGRLAHFPPPLRGEELDSAQVRLGKMLFYDPILSADSTVSCASCHSPFHAFAHTDHALSHGIGDRMGTRNAPGLFNLAWQEDFMWDGAIHDLDFQALRPISDTNEMGSSLAEAVERLGRAEGRYGQAFARAYGEGGVTGERVLRALSAFQLSLVSAGSRYDGWRRGEDSLTPQELRGYDLFRAHCNACHTEPLFAGTTPASNGLPPDPFLNDVGRAGVTGREEDRYRFKVPSLRNLAYTYPYMHDGRFRRLHEVLAHYAEGIGPGASPPLTGPLGLTDGERVDLIAFLGTLNDRDFVYAEEHREGRERREN
ncbi:MAG: hypothetical protein RJA19_1244 [Bacteroidota bacterium]